jgi:5-methylcytosine-specific restriction endonuclease McrA
LRQIRCMTDYPFKMSHIEFRIDECVLVIVNLDKGERLGLSEGFASFIREHGKCSFCDSAFSSKLNKCSCSKPKSRKEHLRVRFPTAIYYSVLQPILRKEDGRKKMAIRQERIMENGGSHTRNDLAVLIAIQENSCYFCGTEIELKSGLKKAHADHYESIFDGGRNDIQNLVMTCSPCNLKKGAMDGSYFERLIKKSRTPETGKKLGVIRRKLNIYKNKFA